MLQVSSAAVLCWEVQSAAIEAFVMYPIAQALIAFPVYSIYSIQQGTALV